MKQASLSGAVVGLIGLHILMDDPEDLNALASDSGQGARTLAADGTGVDDAIDKPHGS
jgi:hypothetical protein